MQHRIYAIMIQLLRRKRLNWQQISEPQTKTKYRRKQLSAKSIIRRKISLFVWKLYLFESYAVVSSLLQYLLITLD